jgi:16S rRNA (adenine1518-N6/adenine1519-N6)-dimethyltransferase
MDANIVESRAISTSSAMPTKREQPPFAKRSFGQNFLVDRRIIERIVDALAPGHDDEVVEIGPGRGALTRSLADAGARLTAIELDRDLITELQQEFADSPNVTILPADALTVDFSAIASSNGKKLKLVANLPYNISTAILRRLARQREAFSVLVLMFQREVVERLAAQPGSSARGFLTVLVEAFFEVERLFDVPPTAFRPVPKVWSSVVRLTPKPEAPPLAGNEEVFEQVISTAFQRKRKTIHNNFRASGMKRFPKDVPAWLASCEIDPNRRAESITLPEWMCLLAAMSENRPGGRQ